MKKIEIEISDEIFDKLQDITKAIQEGRFKNLEESDAIAAAIYYYHETFI